ncbi:MAG: acetyl-CoA C-acetyltransferase [Saprospiraceae bacterium]|nr:acetyl-CoA C-acetyltransferase [Saprospiraceae bacterium]
MSEAYIFDALRTPRGRGKTSGALYEVKPIDLLATTLTALKERNQIPTQEVDDVLIGCVTPIDDQGYNIAKAGLLHADWAESVGGMQINRYCASGLEAVNLAASKVRSGWESLIVAGGIESMSRVPIGSDGGALMYDPELINSVKFVPQGIAADLIATIEDFDREILDEYALSSHQKAANAWEAGYFEGAIIPIFDRNGLPLLKQDEHIRPDTSLERLAQLTPSFSEMGEYGFDALAKQAFPMVSQVRHVHTAGNSCGIVDGAALLLIGNEQKAQELDLKARARIVAAANISVNPTIMLTGAAPASEKALRLAGMKKSDIDLWECNEAFASVVLKYQRDLDIDPDTLNVNGGAIAMGHPLGATGAILLGTLLDELERRDLQTGLVSLCVGGGMGVATIIERV